jgi:hypothetical protein
MNKHSIQNDPDIQRIMEENNKPKLYTELEVIELLILCKDKFGGSELYDYTSDDDVIKWFNNLKK